MHLQVASFQGHPETVTMRELTQWIIYVQWKALNPLSLPHPDLIPSGWNCLAISRRIKLHSDRHTEKETFSLLLSLLERVCHSRLNAKILGRGWVYSTISKRMEPLLPSQQAAIRINKWLKSEEHWFTLWPETMFFYRTSPSFPILEIATV